MTKPFCTLQGLHDLLRSRRVTGMNKNLFLLTHRGVKFLVYSMSSYKAQNNFHKQRLKETNALAPASLRKSFWILFWLCSGSGGQFMSIFSSFFQKCCRLNFAPNNLDRVPLHFLDEPLSSIMTNYGIWWYVTRTSPPKAVEEKERLREIFLAKKTPFSSSFV